MAPIASMAWESFSMPNGTIVSFNPIYTTDDNPSGKRPCSWCKTPTGRSCDYCDRTYTCPESGATGRPLCSLHDCPLDVRLPGMCTVCYVREQPEHNMSHHPRNLIHPISLDKLEHILATSSPGPWITGYVPTYWFGTTPNPLSLGGCPKFPVNFVTQQRLQCQIRCNRAKSLQQSTQRQISTPT